MSFVYIISGISPCCNSSIESTSCLHRLSPSLLQDSSSNQNMKHALQQLKTALMGPDDDEDTTMPNASIEKSNRLQASSSQLIQPNPSFVSGHRQPGEGASDDKCQKAVEEASLHNKTRGNLKQVLIACARALAENNTVVSISGEPIQRLGAYLIEGLVARKELSGTNIYRVLRCRELESKDLLSYMHILYEVSPYLKFDHMVANRAIAKACKNEDRIHIIDFKISQGTHWLTLLQALAIRPDGAPYVRITGIDDPVNKYGRGDGLGAFGRRLSVDMTNPSDGLLRMVKSLNPKLTIFVEQESNTNTTPFLARFVETVEFYLAMFECIDVTRPRDQTERIGVEQQCLARDIVNIFACEGKERVERHELLGKWKSRFTMAGFRRYPLSSYVNSVIRSLLRCYSEHYTLVEKDGAMLLGWKDRNLISASAWR
ncbi:hypothetical protein K2173_004766 [Erythroxylum novogranatense]|uniref:Uncharacterized protein n=1 Tax=Erythroxylum novogranatense TaxID=1862640 RepID=A0AAV8SKJ4_9ROSI|nr:hypothetical protein K2173_004766 [Erythroxylum novogranatense]